MTNKSADRDAFTLIEVMVAVMRISVVIMALMQMYANNTHIFTSMKQQTKINQYSSFLISNENYGFNDKNIYLHALVRDFDLENDLRRELKDIKIRMLYKKLETIDISEQSNDEDIEASSGLVLEIGESIIQTDDGSTALIRFQIR